MTCIDASAESAGIGSPVWLNEDDVESCGLSGSVDAVVAFGATAAAAAPPSADALGPGALASDAVASATPASPAGAAGGEARLGSAMTASGGGGATGLSSG